MFEFIATVAPKYLKIHSSGQSTGTGVFDFGDVDSCGALHLT
jgi:hypothetical protein